MLKKFNIRRRHFLGAAAVTIAATQLGVIGSANAQSSTTQSADLPMIKPETHTSFGPLKQIKAGLLNVGYAEAGPSHGPVVMLLHGWPYDIHSYVDVAPLLAAAGYRVIVPHLRGHGTTSFLSSATFRNGQQSAVALDIIALMDALKIEKAIFAGYDWGTRTAVIIAALWPERCKALVAVGGYTINNLEINKLPVAPKIEQGWWYQYYFATPRGEAGLRENAHDLGEVVWKTNSPKWDFDQATFDRTAASFTNPDYTNIVVHNYRWRLSLAAGEPQYDDLEKQLAASPIVSVPTITIDGDSDGVTAATDGSAYDKLFSGKHPHRIFKGIGHNVPQEAPMAFAKAIIEVDGYAR